jgi:ABC-type phosphate transport system substrate-binding protein
MRLFALIAFAVCLSATARAQDTTFVVNNTTKVPSLTADEVKNILLGKQVSLPGGIAVKLVVQADGPVQEKVIRDFTQRTTDQFDKYWERQVFSGKGIMPTRCGSDAEVIEMVSKTPGAFGYVAKASLTTAVTAVDVH